MSFVGFMLSNIFFESIIFFVWFVLIRKVREKAVGAITDPQVGCVNIPTGLVSAG